MSILGKIFGRIFPKAHAAQPPTATQAAPGATSQPSPQTTQPGAAAAVAERVDIEAVLDGMAAQNAQKLNWRTSIVDLMKLVGMESSLQERKELADELGYSGDKSDSAAMNIWLHKEVMKRMEQNGGKVPANLKD